jgi:hypothetical protein
LIASIEISSSLLMISKENKIKKQEETGEGIKKTPFPLARGECELS